MATPLPRTFFFYGTLMDATVMEEVTGRRGDTLCREPAIIEGYRRVFKAGAWYPILIAETERAVEGILVTGLQPRDVANLIAFEGDGYRLCPLPVRSRRRGWVDAWTFMARPGIAASTEEWTPETWRRRYRKDYVRRVRRLKRPDA